LAIEQRQKMIPLFPRLRGSDAASLRRVDAGFVSILWSGTGLESRQSGQNPVRAKTISSSSF